MKTFRLVYNFVFHTKRRKLTAHALLLSAVARALVRFLPSKALYPYMGTQGEQTPEEELPYGDEVNASWVAHKVSRVARRTPWESRCLVQAMVAQRLLQQYGLSSTLYLGVGRDEEKKMIAHAWVRCGTRFICGGNGDTYAVVAFFSMHPQA